MGDLEGESWLSAREFNMNLMKMDWHENSEFYKTMSLYLFNCCPSVRVTEKKNFENFETSLESTTFPDNISQSPSDHFNQFASPKSKTYTRSCKKFIKII